MTLTENKQDVQAGNEHGNSPGNQGSLERGLAGDYPLSVGAVISEAWGRVAGNKGTIWVAILIYMGVTFVISLVLGLLLGTTPTPTPTEGVSGAATPMEQLQQLITTVIVTPMWVGTVFLGVAIASDQPSSPTSIFAWYGKTLKLFITYILMGLMILLGLILLVLPGIYLAVAYQLALPLAADKDLSPWQALEASRKTVTHKWFTFFALWLIVALAVTASMVLLGIPLIWVLPACLIGLGVVYRDAIGAEPASLRRAAGD